MDDAAVVFNGRGDEGEVFTVDAPPVLWRRKVLEAFLAQHYTRPARAAGAGTAVQPVDPSPCWRHWREQSGCAELHAVHQPANTAVRGWTWPQQNAELQLARLLAEEGSQQARTRALARGAGSAAETPGDSAPSSALTSRTRRARLPASCVVFHHHKIQSSEYRRFKIDGITGGDDYAAMRQVLYAPLQQSRPSPARSRRCRAAGRAYVTAAGHLVLVDGGKGQVSMAREVFTDLGLDTGAHRGGRER